MQLLLSCDFSIIKLRHVSSSAPSTHPHQQKKIERKTSFLFLGRGLGGAGFAKHTDAILRSIINLQTRAK